MPARSAKFPARDRSAPQQVTHQEEDIGRPLRKPPHEIGIPRLPVWDIQPQPVSFVNQPLLDIAANAVEHLEFEGIARDLARLHETLGLFDDLLVMRGYSRIYACFEQKVHQFDEIAVHLRLALESHRGRLQISAFAQTHANTARAQHFYILAAAIQVSLDHRAGRFVTVVQIGDEVERAVGVFARFHVHAHEVAQRGGLANQRLDVGGALGQRKVHAELRQFQRDVAVDSELGDFGERPQVGVPGGSRFFQRCNVLAQMIKGDGNAFGINPLAGGQGVGQMVSRHEAGRQASGPTGGFHPFPQMLLAREEQEERAHVVPFQFTITSAHLSGAGPRPAAPLRPPGRAFNNFGVFLPPGAAPPGPPPRNVTPPPELPSAGAPETGARCHWSPTRARAGSSSPLPPRTPGGATDRRARHAAGDSCRDRLLRRACRRSQAPPRDRSTWTLPPRGSTTRSETVAGVREDRTGARSEASPYLRRALPGNVPPKSPLAARTVRARHREPHPPTAKPRRSAADPSGPGPVAPEPQDPRPHPDARPAARREAA